MNKRIDTPKGFYRHDLHTALSATMINLGLSRAQAAQFVADMLGDTLNHVQNSISLYMVGTKRAPRKKAA